MKIIGVIPARYQSSRLKNKPLIQLQGKPLIQLTYEAVLKSNLFDDIYIATDSKKIIDIVKSFQLPKVKTFLRSKKTSLDTSSTESAMLEFIEKMNFDNLKINVLCSYLTFVIQQSKDISIGPKIIQIIIINTANIFYLKK